AAPKSTRARPERIASPSLTVSPDMNAVNLPMAGTLAPAPARPDEPRRGRGPRWDSPHPDEAASSCRPVPGVSTLDVSYRTDRTCSAGRTSARTARSPSRAAGRTGPAAARTAWAAASAGRSSRAGPRSHPKTPTRTAGRTGTVAGTVAAAETAADRSRRTAGRTGTAAAADRTGTAADRKATGRRATVPGEPGP